ncbi:MAG: FGGY family carbohydrate kinase [Bacteroidota bacterium]
MYLLGYDIGSSSVKAALVDADSGQTIARFQSPQTEMEMEALALGWAEQAPEMWWKHVVAVSQMLVKAHPEAAQHILAIGIAYQMHGLVVVDKNQEVLRPSIIWCDSRAVKIGKQAFDQIGPEKCLRHLLNSPGNFTASKLKWVKDHEPERYQQIDQMMLPGDYIAMKMTGEIATTISGLSEGMLWDFQNNTVADWLLDHYDLDATLIPPVLPTCSDQGRLSRLAATQLGFQPGIPITYRAGDQPNNALALNVLKPGEVAATGGTSGVVYGLVDQAVYDPASRVNGFAHVNYQAAHPIIGILLCINGAGSQYRWINQQIAERGTSYVDMEQLIAEVPIGADGLHVLPYGNGAERMLGDQNLGAKVLNLQFNRHQRAHLFRAALEGIAFSFVYGIEILRDLGLNLNMLRVGNDNLFQSAVFSNSISSILGNQIEVIETTGAVGAAKAAGVAVGHYSSLHEAMQQTEVLKSFFPQSDAQAYLDAYQNWRSDLIKNIST